MEFLGKSKLMFGNLLKNSIGRILNWRIIVLYDMERDTCLLYKKLNNDMVNLETFAILAYSSVFWRL